MPASGNLFPAGLATISSRASSTFAQRLYDLLIEAIDRCDAVVAILDGAESDSGTCVEIGYAGQKQAK